MALPTNFVSVTKCFAYPAPKIWSVSILCVSHLRCVSLGVLKSKGKAWKWSADFFMWGKNSFAGKNGQWGARYFFITFCNTLGLKIYPESSALTEPLVQASQIRSLGVPGLLATWLSLQPGRGSRTPYAHIHLCVWSNILFFLFECSLV